MCMCNLSSLKVMYYFSEGLMICDSLQEYYVVHGSLSKAGASNIWPAGLMWPMKHFHPARGIIQDHQLGFLLTKAL
jgi:hypothetical protein